MSSCDYPTLENHLRRATSLFAQGRLSLQDLQNVLEWFSARVRTLAEAEKAALGHPNTYIEAQKAEYLAHVKVGDRLLTQIMGR